MGQIATIDRRAPGHVTGAARWPVRIAMFAALAAGTAIPAAAQDTEIERLRADVQRLTDQVGALTERVRALESELQQRRASGASSKNGAVAPASAEEATVRQLRTVWPRVQRDLTTQQVLDLLGMPTTKMRINGKQVWYYVYSGIGSGSVFFNEDGTVSSAQAPATGWQ